MQSGIIQGRHRQYHPPRLSTSLLVAEYKCRIKKKKSWHVDDVTIRWLDIPCQPLKLHSCQQIIISKMKHAWSHSCIFSAPGTCLLSHPFIDLNIGQGDSQKGSSSLLLMCPSVKYMGSRDKVTWGGTELLWSKCYEHQVGLQLLSAMVW